jgi:hypothetical protein
LLQGWRRLRGWQQELEMQQQGWGWVIPVQQQQGWGCLLALQQLQGWG